MKVKKFFHRNPYTLILIVIMIVVIMAFSIAKGNTFWGLGFWKGVASQFPEYGVMAIGLMFAFILGQMDLSFVMLGNFATIMGSLYLINSVTEDMSDNIVIRHILIALLIIIAIGTCGGIINGLLISKLGIPPVIATISMQMVWLGVSTGITSGESISLQTVPLYASIGHRNVFGFIPFPLFVFILMYILAALILKFTTYGKMLYMCGSNMKAGRFSGINTDMLIIGTLILCDIVCCMGSMLMVSTLNSAKADNGDSYTMTIILILVMAGILPNGGIGKVGNLIFSVIIIQVIKSGVNMFSSLNVYHASFIYGGLLILILIISTFISGGAPRLKVKKKRTNSF